MMREAHGKWQFMHLEKGTRAEREEITAFDFQNKNKSRPVRLLARKFWQSKKHTGMHRTQPT